MDTQYIAKLEKRIETNRKHIAQLEGYIHGPSLPGSFVTGRSGQSTTYGRKLDRQLDKTINSAVELQQRRAWLESDTAQLENYRAGKATKQGRRIKTDARKQAEKQAAALDRAEKLKNRLFIGLFPAGFVYCDRAREQHGDYMKLAFLSYSTLELQWRADKMPAALRAEIEQHAASIQAKRGEHYQVTTSGQTVLLGS